MRIGLLCPSIYMSAKKYGDMIFAPRDLVVALADGLVDKGHAVFLFASHDTQTKATLIPGDEQLLLHDYTEDKIKSTSTERYRWASFYAVKRNYEMDLTERCYKMALDNKLDVVHSYHDTLAHFFDELTGFPTIYTLHDPISTNEISVNYWLSQKFSHHKYVSISNTFRNHPTIKLNFVDTVYHGIKFDLKPIATSNGEYLACMGRMVKEKGIDQAIDAAIQTHIPLKIATSKWEENKNLPYFKDVIELKIKNTDLVSFTGFMAGEAKEEFLNHARCFLFPIQWEEPFGLVMIEAMATGTPVIAYNRGSVAEIVKDGVTGFIIDPGYGVPRLVSPDDNDSRWIIKKRGIEGLVEAIRRIGEIDRLGCRRHVEQNFTIEKMIEGYEKVYQKVMRDK